MKTIISLIIALAPLTVFSNSLSSSKIAIKKQTYISRPKTRDSDAFQGQKAKLLAKRRTTLISDVKEALKTSRDKSHRAELELRLVNLYIEEYKFSGGGSGEAKSLLKKAKSLLQNLFQHYPSFHRIDEAKFQLAQLHLEFLEQEKANMLFLNIVSNHPQSEFVEESLLQLADDAFMKNKFSKALEFYAALLADPESQLAPYAHYKSGWASYNSGKLSQAAQHFEKVINIEASSSLSNHSIALKKEALKDLCFPLSELKQYQHGKEFYSTQEESVERSGIECLAHFASDKGDFSEAIFLYNHLLSLDSQSAQNPQYTLAIARVLQKQNQLEPLSTFLQSSLPYYLDSSVWNEIHSHSPTLMKQIKDSFETLVRTLASETHAVAQKTKSPSQYNFAKIFYDLYLSHFSLFPGAARSQFYLAEILFKQKQFDEAAQAYHLAFKKFPQKSKMKKTSIEYALLSRLSEINLERKRNGQKEISKEMHTKIKANQSESDQTPDFSKAEVHFMELSDSFLKEYPQSPTAPEILFKTGYLKYAHLDSKRAYDDFFRLVTVYPGDRTAIYAGSLLLDILNQEEKYSELIEASQKLLAQRELKDTSFRDETSDILRKSELKLISQLEEEQKFDLAAERYLLFISKYGKQDASLHEKALFNAGICLEKTNRLAASIQVKEQFLSLFRRSNFRAQLILEVAKHYEAQANFGKAAHYFSMFQEENAHHAQSAESLRLAGLYFWGAGLREKAERSMLRHLSLFPEFRETTEKDLIDFYSHEGLLEKKKKYLSVERSKKGTSPLRYLDFTLRLIDLEEASDSKQAQLLWKEADQFVSRNEQSLLRHLEGSQAVGKVFLKRAQKLENQFSTIRFTTSNNDQEKLLKRKLELTKNLEKQYAHIASLGGEVGLMALLKTASIYKELSSEVSEAPIPDGLTADQKEIYRTELSKQMIIPFKEKALGFSAQCLEKAQELSINSFWVSHCYEISTKIDPQSYQSLVTFSLPPFYIAYLSSPLSDEIKTALHYHSPFFFSEQDKERAFFQLDSAVKKVSLQPLLSYREKILRADLRGHSHPETPEQHFRTLNAKRLSDPRKAIPEIKAYLKINSSDSSFHNLLALSYLENKEFEKAKVTWLSLLARGFSDPAIFNNLGVLEALRGNEEEALILWKKAETENLPEALVNQGFVAVSYRNGSLAKSFFERAQDHRKDELAELGTQISNLQIRVDDDTKKEFMNFAEKFPENPVIESQISALSQQGRALASDNNGLPDL